MPDKFDAIVIGAGPAGCAAAGSMARAGLSVLVLERGEYPGSKNASGAVLYPSALDCLTGDFWQDAPIERRITRHITGVLAEDSSIEVQFVQANPSNPGVSVLRAKFDRWFAQKATPIRIPPGCRWGFTP